ncbi:MAG: rluB [Mucilaginibacter sp.]|nr:rluB [Mucilaginibacter sp.]
MAFNRPGNSRDDKSGRSSNRAPKAGDRPKRSTSSRGNSTPGSDQAKSTRPSKKYNSEGSGEKRSFSSPGKSSYDKPASSFSGGEKKAFTGKSRPYSGRPSDGESSGEKRAFAPKRRPYTGRIADNDPRPGKSFGGERTGDKKPFTSRSKPSTGSFNADDKPKRSFGGERTGDKKFGDRPSAGAGFKRTGGDRPYDADKPHRSKPRYDKITKDQDAPAKTLRGRKKGPETKDTGLIRLNRYISNAGICSRRKADELIAAGVVSVNGTVINELGHKVDPQKDEIRYNGELLKREKMVYVLLNKPKDYITTTEDPQERRTVMHLVEKASKERIYPVGRLDRNTTGLLLMTNDGDLADKLSHPRNSIVKLYQVELNKSLTQGDMNKIGFGLELEDGLIKPDSISYVAGGSKREIGIQIHSGKNRIVRRMFEHLGYEVVKLDRAVYANLTKKDLPRGRWRFLEEKEVIQLKHLIQG